jgi:hypothetical protein
MCYERTTSIHIKLKGCETKFSVTIDGETKIKCGAKGKYIGEVDIEIDIQK